MATPLPAQKNNMFESLAAEAERWLLLQEDKLQDLRQPRWNNLRRKPPNGMNASIDVRPPLRIVYLLRDPVRAVASVLAAAHVAEDTDGGLIGHCALAGCLLPFALEYLASVAGCNDSDAHTDDVSHNATNVHGKHDRCSSQISVEDRRLGHYAVGGVDFLLLQHHFDQWAAAARTGAFQMMVVKDSDLPAALPVVARFLDLSIPPSPQDGSELIPYDDRSVRAFTFNNGIGLPVNGVNSKQHEAAETCQGQQIIKQRLQDVLGRFEAYIDALPPAFLFPQRLLQEDQTQIELNGSCSPGRLTLEELLAPFALRDWCACGSADTPVPSMTAEGWIPGWQLDRVVSKSEQGRQVAAMKMWKAMMADVPPTNT